MLLRSWLSRFHPGSRRRSPAVAAVERCEDRTLLSATLVKDINPGTASSSLYTSIVFNDNLYFLANDGPHGSELWKSDGTTGGTVLIKDIYPGSGNSYPGPLVNFNGTLYFIADDGVHGRELWKSDGTTNGTMMVVDLISGSESPQINNLTVVGNTLFFSAYDTNGENGLWKSDGTAAGTTLVKLFPDSYPSFSARTVYEIIELNGQAVFTVHSTSSQNGIWTSDGTLAGTTLVSASGGVNPNEDYNLTKVGSSLFFTRVVRYPGVSYELWKTDGTVSGTALVKANTPFFLERGYDLNGLLLNVTDMGVYVSNGTEVGTFSLSDSVPNFSSFYLDTVIVNNLAYIQAGNRLWKTDGTIVGTEIALTQLQLHNYYGSSDYPYPNAIVVGVGNQLFITATDTVHGIELYRSGGTDAGTEIVADIRPGSGTGVSTILAANSQYLFISAGDVSTGYELYKVPLVEPVVSNSAPVLDPAGNPTLDPIVEETPAANITGNLVSTILSRMTPGGITDADPNSLQGIAIIGANQSGGKWQYSFDNAATWFDFGTVSNVSALLLASDASTRVRFIPNNNFAGPTGFTFVAWDHFTGQEGTKVPVTIRGGSTAFSLASEDVYINIINTQDAPFLDPASQFKLPDLNEDTPSASNAGSTIATLITNYQSGSGITDPDPGTPKGIALIGVDQVNGTWQFSTNGGTTWTNVGTPSQTSALLLSADNNTRLRFFPNLNYFGNAAFAYRAWDQTSGTNGTYVSIPSWTSTSAFSSNSATGSVKVLPVNDPPAVLTLSRTYIEEQLPIGSIVGTFSAIDVDPNPSFTYTLVSGTGATDNGSFSIAGNTLKTSAIFDHDVKSSYSIRVRVTDNANGILEQVFNITITPSVDKLATFGVFRGGNFYLDASRNRKWDGTAGGDTLFGFAAATDIPIAGDWNGDGKTDIGVFRNGSFYLDFNGSRSWNGTAGGDFLFGFGNSTDTPITGDWNGDGRTDIGVWRNGIFYLDQNGNFKWDGISGGDASFGFGSVIDTPVTGDWNGDGLFDVGVFRAGTFYLDQNGNRFWNGPTGGDAQFGFSAATDTPITGDWNGDGKTDVGVWRAGTFYIDLNGNQRWDGTNGGDFSRGFGATTDIPLIGTWGPQSVSPSVAPSAETLASLIAPTSNSVGTKKHKAASI